MSLTIAPLKKNSAVVQQLYTQLLPILYDIISGKPADAYKEKFAVWHAETLKYVDTVLKPDFLRNEAVQRELEKMQKDGKTKAELDEYAEAAFQKAYDITLPDWSFILAFQETYRELDHIEPTTDREAFDLAAAAAISACHVLGAEVRDVYPPKLREKILLELLDENRHEDTSELQERIEIELWNPSQTLASNSTIIANALKGRSKDIMQLLDNSIIPNHQSQERSEIFRKGYRTFATEVGEDENEIEYYSFLPTFANLGTDKITSDRRRALRRLAILGNETIEVDEEMASSDSAEPAGSQAVGGPVEEPGFQQTQPAAPQAIQGAGIPHTVLQQAGPVEEQQAAPQAIQGLGIPHTVLQQAGPVEEQQAAPQAIQGVGIPHTVLQQAGPVEAPQAARTVTFKQLPGTGFESDESPGQQASYDMEHVQYPEKSRTVAWGRRGYGRFYINRLGRAGASIYRIQDRPIPNTEDNVDWGNPPPELCCTNATFRNGEKRDSAGNLLYSLKHMKGIYGVAFDASRNPFKNLPDYEAMNSDRYDGIRFIGCYIRVAWEVAPGQIQKTWELRDSLRPAMRYRRKGADNAIYQAAMQEQKRYENAVQTNWQGVRDTTPGYIPPVQSTSPPRHSSPEGGTSQPTEGTRAGTEETQASKPDSSHEVLKQMLLAEFGVNKLTDLNSGQKKEFMRHLREFMAA